MSEEDEEKPVVVAQLASDVPYSCVSSSPDGRLVIMGGKDTVQIVSVKPSGLKEVRSIRISQFFQAQRTVGTSGNQSSLGGGGPNDSRSVRDIFSTATSQNTSSAMTMINVNVSDVAWSICQTQDDDDRLPEVIPETSTLDSDLQDYGHDAKNDPFEAIFSMPGDLRMADESLIAAAGSNGVVLIWRACDLLKGLSDMNRNKQDFYKQLYGNFGTKASDPSSSSIGYPEAVLVEHSKAVKVAWHPNLPNLLLTASLDGTAQLWERFEIGLDTPSQPETSKWSWLSSLSTAQYDNAHERSFSWKCKQVFKPNCGGIRAVQWSTFSDDLFAMVTNNGFLVVYYTIVPHRPAVRIAAHAREATTVDWHPTKPFVIATGGVDMKVKVWDLEEDLSLSNFDEDITFNDKSNRSHGSIGSSSNDTSSPNTTQGQDNLDHSYHGAGHLTPSEPTMSISRSNSTHHNFTYSAALRPTDTAMKRSSVFQNSLTRNAKNATSKLATSKLIHELSVSAQVEKLKWRPPKRPLISADRSRHLISNNNQPDHHVAMLAVATTVTGATSGGCGKVYLWSCHRPFMPLSIVDGHEEKSVADFIWLDTPDVKEIPPRRIPTSSLSKIILSQQASSGVTNEVGGRSLIGTWQHVLTVGKDGKCLIQSFCRGQKPIAKVPPSAFAIAELSPFQKGFGSLQLIATHQNVPSGARNEYEVCGFRRDNMSAQAPGIFKEEAVPARGDNDNKNAFQWDPNLGGLKDQSVNLNLTFSTTDSGDLDSISTKAKSDEVVIAPEVVHLSRFADSYKLRKDSISRTKAAICRHNSNVARKLNCIALSQMWKMLASILEGSGSEDLADANFKKGFPRNALLFALLPTLKNILIERADAGDVQTCVVICEVMEVIPKKSPSALDVSLAVPGLNLMLVRQWYLSYIDLLQQMCLFSHATNLIRLSHDPEINKLNQQSTTFYESCPTCSKPLQASEKSCRSCRQKIGLCFLCHETVKGIFVWCPGCGHGGHLDHALEWFGGNNGDKLRELCPTGCGHRCNLIQMSHSTIGSGGVALCQEIKSKQ